MKKLIFIAFLFMLGVTVANAQGVRFGAKAGVNFSGANGDDVPDVSSRTGLNIGAVVNFELSELFAIQPEVTYSMRGFKDGDFEIKVDYVDIPIMADVTIAEGLSLQGGPIIGVNVTATAEDTSSGIEGDIEDISTLNIGAGIGAQYELPMGLFFNLRYDMGFNDIIDNDFDAKNCNLALSAGFFF